MKAIPTSSTTPATCGGNVFDTKYVCDMRFKLRHPETFAVTSVYLTRTDSNRFRVKAFRSGKCLVAKYVTADDWAELLNNVATLFNL
jgi:hypothetical protein